MMEPSGMTLERSWLAELLRNFNHLPIDLDVLDKSQEALLIKNFINGLAGPIKARMLANPIVQTGDGIRTRP
jgi:hypothetical protein